MKPKILIPCLLALAVVVGLIVWKQQPRPGVEATNGTKPTNAEGGTRSVASTVRSDITANDSGVSQTRLPVATSAPGSAQHTASGHATGSGTTNARKVPGLKDQPGSVPAEVATGPSQELPWHRGEEAVAAVTRADGTTTGGLRLNQVNAFSQVKIQPEEMVTVTVAWPQGSPGDTVAALVEDGGRLANAELGMPKAEDEGNRVLKLTLDANRQMRFAFTASEASGMFRVTLRKGTEIKTVQFWAGPEPELAAAAE